MRSANNEDISHIVPKVQQPTHPPACGSAPVLSPGQAAGSRAQLQPQPGVNIAAGPVRVPAFQQRQQHTCNMCPCHLCAPPPVVQVVFKLHPSFAQPVRPVEGPSFELTETGWGEFDIGVEVGLLTPTPTLDVVGIPSAMCVCVWTCSRPDRSLRVEYLGQGPHHLKLWFSHVVLCCAVLCPQLHFAADAGEKPVEVFHRLKLYADDDPTGQTRKPVVSVGCTLLLPCRLACCC